MFVLKDDVILRRPGSRQMTGAQFKQQFGIDGIVYHNGEPDFSAFIVNDSHVGTVIFENGISPYRDITHRLALEELSARSGRSIHEIKEHMRKNDLVFHELGDRKTVIPIPAWLNAVFTHTGGISMQASVLAMRLALRDGCSSFVLKRCTTQKVTVDSAQMRRAIKQKQAQLRQIKREIKKRRQKK